MREKNVKTAISSVSRIVTTCNFDKIHLIIHEKEHSWNMTGGAEEALQVI